MPAVVVTAAAATAVVVIVVVVGVAGVVGGAPGAFGESPAWAFPNRACFCTHASSPGGGGGGGGCAPAALCWAAATADITLPLPSGDLVLDLLLLTCARKKQQLSGREGKGAGALATKACPKVTRARSPACCWPAHGKSSSEVGAKAMALVHLPPRHAP
eukprot:1161624-Pelagomonas_calceolata.AAC.13